MSGAEPTLRARLRALPRPVWILFAGTFLNKFGTFVLPFLVLYLTRNGYSIGEAGLAVSAYGAGNFCASIVGGWLADHLGRRRTIVLSMFSGAATMLALSQARGLPAIVILAALAGLAAEFYRPASSALVGDLVPPENRVTAFAVYRLALNAGFAFGPATAGFLAKYSFFWLFVGDAMSSVLFGIVALVALPQGVTTSRAEAGWGEALKVVKHDRKFLSYLAASMGIAFVFFQTSSTFPLQVKHVGLSDEMFGALLSLNGVIIVFCELPLTIWTQRLPPRQVMSFGFVLIGIGFALIGWATGPAMLAQTVVIWTAGEMCSFPVAGAYIANLAPVNMRGRYNGMAGLMWASGMIAAPAVGMAVFARNPTCLWIVCGAVSLLAAGIVGMGGGGKGRSQK